MSWTLIYLGVILFCLALLVWSLKERNKKCKFCKQEMLLCGFGRPNSIFGNGRYECRNENCETKKDGKQSEITRI